LIRWAEANQPSDEELETYVAPILSDEALQNREELLGKAEELRPLAQGLVDAVQQVSGLDDFSAKTCVYYGIGTHGLEGADLYPILVLQGPAATGKSQAMEVMAFFCREPVPMSTTPSPASLRDGLGNNTTAFIEEANDVDEEIINNRYARRTALKPVKRPQPSGVWKDDVPLFFGATVLHRRQGFKMSATTSRSIVIRTENRPGQYSTADQAETEPGLLKPYAANIWSRCEFRAIREGRIQDVWRPLKTVAANLLDIDWLRRCEKEEKRAMNGLRQGQAIEPDQAVVSALIGLRKPNKRVSFASISDWVRREFNLDLNGWQIGDILRGLGLKPRQSHGAMKVEIDTESLVELAHRLGIEDESFNGDDEPPNGLVTSVRGLQG